MFSSSVRTPSSPEALFHLSITKASLTLTQQTLPTPCALIAARLATKDGRWTLSHPGVKAPGTPNITVVPSAGKSSAVEIFVSLPSAPMVEISHAGMLSPTASRAGGGTPVQRASAGAGTAASVGDRTGGLGGAAGGAAATGVERRASQLRRPTRLPPRQRRRPCQRRRRSLLCLSRSEWSPW